MGRVTGACSICGKISTDVYRCSICGGVVCSGCFMKDVNVCKKCVRKGLWVERQGAE
ncbi:MAG: hypothetical protein QXG10_00880 [Candidatus Hadarchaeales archaeon]